MRERKRGGERAKVIEKKKRKKMRKRKGLRTRKGKGMTLEIMHLCIYASYGSQRGGSRSWRS